MGWIRTRIREHERGLWFRHGNLRRVIDPGAHWTPTRIWSRKRDRIEVYSTLALQFEHALLETLVRHEDLRAQLEVVELNDAQRALVWKDGRLARVLSPGLYAFWRGAGDVRVDVIEATTEPFEHGRIETIIRHADSGQLMQIVGVEPGERALLYVNGRLTRELGPGRYVFWKGVGAIQFRGVDLRERVHDVAGQEIMTRDMVTLRVNLVVVYRVVDLQRSVAVSADFEQAIYRDSQLALRASVGARKLEELLAGKEAVSDEVAGALRQRAGEFGVEVRSVGLRDIILPGDMKTILNRVIEAEKQAQAELIRRREETASARSQANTAKLLEQSPTLTRMRELELLRDILAGAKATIVLGQGDLTEQVRSLVGGEVRKRE